MKIKKFLTFLVLLFMITFASIASASQYNAGSENADVAALGSGLTVGLYNSFYSADSLKDTNGNNIGDFNQFKYTAMIRAFYMTDLCFLGANYGLGVGVPIGYDNVKLNGLSSDAYHFGDMYFEPIILKWAQPSYDVFLTLGVFAPTGAFDANEAVNIGHGYWTGMATLGGRYFFDTAKTWSMYGVARYEMSSEQTDTKLQSGDTFTGEYGLTKAFKFGKDSLSLGAVGYTQVQTTDNKFDGADINDSRAFVTAVGPAVGYRIDSLGLDLGAKAFFELAASNSTEGMKFLLTATKSF